ncbi:hypothetical protein AAY473_029026 [Plecturocebus cupreus]
MPRTASTAVPTMPFSSLGLGSGPALAGHKRASNCWAWWLTPVIPGLWEAEVSRSQGQVFKTSLANMVKPRLY